MSEMLPCPICNQTPNVTLHDGCGDHRIDMYSVRCVMAYNDGTLLPMYNESKNYIGSHHVFTKLCYSRREAELAWNQLVRTIRQSVERRKEGAKQ